jgi:hypothetical protein
LGTRPTPHSGGKKVKLSHYCHEGAKGDRRHSSCSFFISTLDGVSGQSHMLAALNPLESTTSTNWTGGWVGPRAGLNTEATGKILDLCWGENPGSQTLY